MKKSNLIQLPVCAALGLLAINSANAELIDNGATGDGFPAEIVELRRIGK